jgi:hypothetical protein
VATTAPATAFALTPLSVEVLMTLRAPLELDLQGFQIVTVAFLDTGSIYIEVHSLEWLETWAARAYS